ncbi:hypothetical protein SEVIR_4G234500v4 [Setaria viridis]
MEELVMEERVKSIPKEIQSLERRINYLMGRKEHLMTMMRNSADKQQKIEEKLVDHEEEQQTWENYLPQFLTDPSLPPLKKLKKQKVKEGKLVVVEDEGEEHSPGEASPPDSTVTELVLPPLTPRYPLHPSPTSRCRCLLPVTRCNPRGATWMIPRSGRRSTTGSRRSILLSRVFPPRSKVARTPLPAPPWSPQMTRGCSCMWLTLLLAFLIPFSIFILVMIAPVHPVLCSPL